MKIHFYNLRFAGNKAELKIQLDVWCKEAGKSFNGTVIELIEKHLRKNKLARSFKELRADSKRQDGLDYPNLTEK